MKDEYLDNLGRKEAEDLRDRYNAGTLTVQEARDGLAHVWSIAARPGVLLTPSEWRDLWLYAGHIHLYLFPDGSVQWKETERPTRPVRLYRRAYNSFRFSPSWTEDKTFAAKFPAGDTVWTAEFPPERLLATADIKPSIETEYIAFAEELHLDIHP